MHAFKNLSVPCTYFLTWYLTVFTNYSYKAKFLGSELFTFIYNVSRVKQTGEDSCNLSTGNIKRESSANHKW